MNWTLKINHNLPGDRYHLSSAVIGFSVKSSGVSTDDFVSSSPLFNRKNNYGKTVGIQICVKSFRKCSFLFTSP